MREQELFDYLKASHFPDLEKSEGAYDSFDCTTNEKNLYIELKCRHTHYPDLLIEEMKRLSCMSWSTALVLGAVIRLVVQR